MCCDKCEDKQIIGYCFYCKEPIYKSDKYIKVKGKLYHHDNDDPYSNCYYPEDGDVNLTD
jgi:hypothetical protein